MDEKVHIRGDNTLELEVAHARQGDRDALEAVISAVHQDVYRVALHFLWHPEDAEDAAQEILTRVITGLSGFRGESSFRTWVYSVARNTLLTLGRKRMERRAMSFEEFGVDLGRGLSDDPLSKGRGVEEVLLLEEVKIGCTLAMLLCLDREHRMAYILGEIIELDHREGADVMGITPAAFRKRLSRARKRITALMTSRCGLAEPANRCRCRRRAGTAIDLGRVDPDNLLFASSAEQARRFPQVLKEIRGLEKARRAAALYRSHTKPVAARSFASWLRRVLDEDRGPGDGAGPDKRKKGR